MNQTSKKLLFNKSTLLSLKAELLKKQEEVKGKKQLPQHRVENYKPPPPAARSAQSDDNRTSFKDRLKDVDTDELEAQRRSKSALEKKAELYAHMSDGAGSSELAARFLVDFQSKGAKERPAEPVRRQPSEEPDIPTNEYDDDDEWTDFTDCLGRTRRCLKTDVEFYKKRDQEIARTTAVSTPQADLDTSDVAQVEATDVETAVQKQAIPETDAQASENSLLVQKTDAYLQSLRQKWEQKERELVERDRDIHYQDLLFDEARAHGVGYYGFSTEETARRREQAELERARVETKRAQEQAATRRAERDALVAERVSAARARQRVRAGLPPEEPQENKDEFQLHSLLDFLTEQKNESAQKAKAEEQKKRDEREKERQKLRENFVREWDVGKEGIGGDKKDGFREMSQEEYEEQQRSKRIQEFAPVQNNTHEWTHNTFDDKGHFIGNNHELPVRKSWADVRPNVNIESQYTDEMPSGSGQGLYFSSAKESAMSKMNKYSNFVTASEPVPIVNELEEVHQEPSKSIPRRNNQMAGTEIEPPPTYDYYGPTAKRSRTQLGPDVRESYEQGLKFLQAMESKKSMSKNLDLTL